MFDQGSPEAAERYWGVRRVATSVVTISKTQVREEFGEALEKDFWLAI